MEENPPPSRNPCPTSQETKPPPIYDQDKLSIRIFWRLTYNNNVVFPFIRLNHNYKHKEGD